MMYLVPICCITAQVPAMRAPGLYKKKLAFQLRVEDPELSYRDPERLGLAYTPPAKLLGLERLLSGGICPPDHVGLT